MIYKVAIVRNNVTIMGNVHSNCNFISHDVTIPHSYCTTVYHNCDIISHNCYYTVYHNSIFIPQNVTLYFAIVILFLTIATLYGHIAISLYFSYSSSYNCNFIARFDI